MWLRDILHWLKQLWLKLQPVPFPDGMWTDVKPADSASAHTVRIKAFSKAYFDLIDAVPDLREIFAIGDRVTVRGRAVTVVVSESGAEELSATEVRAVVAGW